MPRKTVLLVDSHEDSRAIYTIILEHHGYGVLSTGCLHEGVRLAHERLPDVIFLELPPLRPDLWEAANGLVRHRLTAGIPVVALTTAFTPAERERALGSGFAAFLVKPLSPTALLEHVRHITGTG